MKEESSNKNPILMLGKPRRVGMTHANKEWHEKMAQHAINTFKQKEVDTNFKLFNKAWNETQDLNKYPRRKLK